MDRRQKGITAFLNTDVTNGSPESGIELRVTQSFTADKLLMSRISVNALYSASMPEGYISFSS